MARQNRVRRFHHKLADNAHLQKGGRKSDSTFYRRHLHGKKIAYIHHLIENTNLLVITASLSMPELKPGLVDRFLILAHGEGVEPVIVLTKTDLKGPTRGPADAAAIWRGAGFHVILTSTVTGEGVAELKGWLEGRRSAFVGHSGVGKTSLLTLIDPTYQAAVQEISTFTQRGRHTTTIIRRHTLAFGGEVYDMPGLKELDFMSLERGDLGDCYPDFTESRSKCKFADCSHTHEETCGVKAAALEKRIHPVRYENYLQIFDSLPK